jgi:hypothetical protein
MFAKLRPRSVYDVMAALSLFLVVAGGTALPPTRCSAPTSSMGR